MSLSVKPISAFLTRDTEIFSNMDPYVIAIVGSDKQRSRTHQEGGKKPRWTDQFLFRPQSSSMLVTVYDEDIVSDDVVGSANVMLKKYLDNPGVQYDENIALSYSGKSSGNIKMIIKYNLPQSGPWPNNGNQNTWITPQNQVKPPNNYGNNGWGQPSYPQSQPQPQPYSQPNNNQPFYPQPSYSQPQPSYNNGWNNQLNQQAAIPLLNQSQKSISHNNQFKNGQAIWNNILEANLSQQNGWGSNTNINTPPSNNGWGSNNNIGNNGWGSNNNIGNNGWGSNNNINNGWGTNTNGWQNQNNGW